MTGFNLPPGCTVNDIERDQGTLIDRIEAAFDFGIGEMPPRKMARLLNDVVKSISNNEDEILLGIMQLHNGGKPFEADVTYNVGGLYKTGRVPIPSLKFDINPQTAKTRQADVIALPLEPESLSSIVFDPPFMFNPHGTARAKNRANLRYTMFDTWADLERTYKAALDEFRRVLKPKGIVAFKCQDYTDAKTTLTHCLVYQWATERGFYAKDLLIRYRNHGPAYNVYLRQKHARKFHSYWFVLERQP